jgi:hypothetical protein
MEYGFHEFIVIQKGGVWVNVTLVKVLSHTVGSYKECVIDDLHKLSWMSINSTKQNLNSERALLLFVIRLRIVNFREHKPQTIRVFLRISLIRKTRLQIHNSRLLFCRRRPN